MFARRILRRVCWWASELTAKTRYLTLGDWMPPTICFYRKWNEGDALSVTCIKSCSHFTIPSILECITRLLGLAIYLPLPTVKGWLLSRRERHLFLDPNCGEKCPPDEQQCQELGHGTRGLAPNRLSGRFCKECRKYHCVNNTTLLNKNMPKNTRIITPFIPIAN